METLIGARNPIGFFHARISFGKRLDFLPSACRRGGRPTGSSWSVFLALQPSGDGVAFFPVGNAAVEFVAFPFLGTGGEGGGFGDVLAVGFDDGGKAGLGGEVGVFAGIVLVVVEFFAAVAVADFERLLRTASFFQLMWTGLSQSAVGFLRSGELRKVSDTDSSQMDFIAPSRPRR